jgi:hypothetical protein
MKPLTELEQQISRAPENHEIYFVQEAITITTDVIKHLKANSIKFNMILDTKQIKKPKNIINDTLVNQHYFTNRLNKQFLKSPVNREDQDEQPDVPTPQLDDPIALTSSHKLMKEICSLRSLSVAAVDSHQTSSRDYFREIP